MRLAAPEHLWLLWLLPLLAAAYWCYGRGARRRLARFAPEERWGGLIRARGATRPFARFGLLLLSTVLTVAALARPQTGSHPVAAQREGIDVMVVLDVSYSMAAEDVAPNRLTIAKKEIERLARSLEGNRLGLVIFAGGSSVEVPLTDDIETFRMFLSTAAFNGGVGGGTAIASAMRKAAAALRREGNHARAIVLVSDGEEHEGTMLEEARRIAEEGITVHAVAVGAPAGAPIPERDEEGHLLGYRKDALGGTVLTRPNVDALRAAAEAGGGLFAASAGNGLDIGPVIAALGNAEKGPAGEMRFTEYDERFQWPLGGGLALLLAAWFL